MNRRPPDQPTGACYGGNQAWVFVSGSDLRAAARIRSERSVPAVARARVSAPTRVERVARSASSLVESQRANRSDTLGVRGSGRGVGVVGGQSDARPVAGQPAPPVVAVLGRQVVVDQVLAGGPVVARMPGVELRQQHPEIGERLDGGLGEQRLLGGELLVEAAVGEPDLRHEISDTDRLHAALAEQPRGRRDDLLAVLLRLRLRYPSHVPPPAPTIDERSHLLPLSGGRSTVPSVPKRGG